jgi:Cytochrome C oxidase, cbb3-type, subunit III
MISIGALTTEVTDTNGEARIFLVQRKAVSSVSVRVLCGVAFVLMPQVRSTWDGIYTDAQSKRGAAIYAERCASCHAPDLSGMDQAPALAGAEFRTEWDGLSMNDLFQRTRISMPADKPGSLEPAQVADTLAFVLQKNGFPASHTALSSTTAELKAITFLAKQP